MLSSEVWDLSFPSDSTTLARKVSTKTCTCPGSSLRGANRVASGNTLKKKKKFDFSTVKGTECFKQIQIHLKPSQAKKPFQGLWGEGCGWEGAVCRTGHLG